MFDTLENATVAAVTVAAAVATLLLKEGKVFFFHICFKSQTENANFI